MNAPSEDQFRKFDLKLRSQVNMVIVQLAGGLGNQLFQYAAGRALARRIQVPLLLDPSLITRDMNRQYRLDHFNIKARIAVQSDIDRVRGWGWRGLPARFRLYLRPHAPYYKRMIFVEQHHHYDPNIWKALRTVYLVGYWQTEKYFRDIEELLRNEFTLRHPPDSTSTLISNQMAQTESVSLHVRRGDYVLDPVINRIHGACSLDYYHTAIEMLVERLQRPHFFVFSDDIDWVISNLQIDYPCTYVSQFFTDKDYNDLHLMSQCKNHIIANSSFSWWGAWLSRNASKVVIAPRKWFEQSDRDTRDVIPDSWHTL